VSVLPANKLSLQESNQLIEIELLTSRFLENFGSLAQFPREASACFVYETLERFIMQYKKAIANSFNKQGMGRAPLVCIKWIPSNFSG